MEIINFANNLYIPSSSVKEPPNKAMKINEDQRIIQRQRPLMTDSHEKIKDQCKLYKVSDQRIPISCKLSNSIMSLFCTYVTYRHIFRLYLSFPSSGVRIIEYHVIMTGETNASLLFDIRNVQLYRVFSVDSNLCYRSTYTSSADKPLDNQTQPQIDFLFLN